MRLLKLDPRPPAYDSVAAATRDDDDATSLIDDAFEMTDWRPVEPAARTDKTASFAFVDGVQQYDARFSAEGDGWPIPGVLATYAAGAMCPGAPEPLCHVSVQRSAILSKGARPAPIEVGTSRGTHRYHPESAAGDDPAALESRLNQLRAEIEASITRRLLEDDQYSLVVVDGRLPQHAAGAVGLIKTPQRVPLTSDTHINVLRGLRRGERSPIFIRTRSDRRYYSWFVCLASPGPHDLAMSGLAMFEMDDSASRAEVTRAADLTASALPRYAPKPHRDPRAPQNLLPVGQLERELRRRMGQREFVLRLIRESFARQEYAWTD